MIVLGPASSISNRLPIKDEDDSSMKPLPLNMNSFNAPHPPPSPPLPVYPLSVHQDSI